MWIHIPFAQLSWTEHAMSVSLSDSLLDLNCSATPNPVANRASGGIESGSSQREGGGGDVNDGAGGSGLNAGAGGSGSNSNNNNNNGAGNGSVAGPSRIYVPVRMEIDDDYQEFCEQFSFEVI